MTSLALARPVPPAFKLIVFGGSACAAPAPVTRVLPNPVLDSLGDDALTLSLNMEALEGALHWNPRDRSVQAAVCTLRARLQEMQDVASAFSDALTALSQPAAAPLLTDDAPLTEYLRGIVAWWAGNLRALERLAEELRAASADWTMLRRRLDEASSFLIPELAQAASADLAWTSRVRGDAALRDVADQLDLLLTTTGWLATGLQARFG